MNNPDFGLPQGYTPPKGVVAPPSVKIPVVNSVCPDHSIALERHRSLYNDEEPKNAFFMSPQMMFVIGTLPNPTTERLCTLKDKFKVMEVHSTPGLDVMDMSSSRNYHPSELQSP